MNKSMNYYSRCMSVLDNYKMVLFYSISFAAIIILFLLYTSDFQEFLCQNYLRNVSIQTKLIEVVPLASILLLGLFISIYNTIIYALNQKGQNALYDNIVIVISFVLLLALASFVCWYLFHINGYIEILKVAENSPNAEGISKSITRECHNKIINKYEMLEEFLSTSTYVIFCFFSIIDICNGWILKVNKLEKNISRQQLFLIDLPVLFGCYFVSLIAEFIIDQSMFSVELGSSFPNLYIHIFKAGAIGLQIIFSQIIFLVLMCMYCHEKTKQGELTSNAEAG